MTAGVPRVAVVTVGEELLSGATLDGNAAWLGRALATLGLRVERRWTVGDREGDIAAAVGAALERAEVVLVTGGLGPTEDDRTRLALASVVGAGAEEEPGQVFPNPAGVAPGLLFDAPGGALVIALPGVPREMRALFPAVAHALTTAFAGRLRPVLQRTIQTTGVPESELAPPVEAVMRSLAEPVEVAWLPELTGVDLRLTVDHDGSREGEAAAARSLDRVEEALAPLVAGFRYDAPSGDLVETVAERLDALTWRLAVAESCTGGLLAQRWTARPGSSRTLRGGVVAYDDGVKRDVLGVPATVLAREGAVSEPVARLMAESVRRLLGAECGVAITGVAGPGGGSEAKPVGTVWIAVTAPATDDEPITRARLFHFPGDRTAVRERAAQAALHLLLCLLDDLLTPGAGAAGDVGG